MARIFLSLLIRSVLSKHDKITLFPHFLSLKIICMCLKMVQSLPASENILGFNINKDDVSATIGNIVDDPYRSFLYFHFFIF